MLAELAVSNQEAFVSVGKSSLKKALN